jgi:hypothetical protein
MYSYETQINRKRKYFFISFEKIIKYLQLIVDQ